MPGWSGQRYNSIELRLILTGFQVQRFDATRYTLSLVRACTGLARLIRLRVKWEDARSVSRQRGEKYSVGN